MRVARWAEGRGEVLSRLWGVWTFLSYVLGRFLKPVGFCYGCCCWRIDLQGRGGQNGCEEAGQVAFSVAGEGGGGGNRALQAVWLNTALFVSSAALCSA